MRRGLFTTLLFVLLAAVTTPAAGVLASAAAKLERVRPTPATLTILTTTINGVGAFGYIAGPYDDDPTHVTATTTRPGLAVQARPETNLRLLSTNRYTIQQLPPNNATGRWVLARVVCNGSTQKIRQEPISHVRYIRLRLRFGRPTACSFVNRLVRTAPSA